MNGYTGPTGATGPTGPSPKIKDYMREQRARGNRMISCERFREELSAAYERGFRAGYDAGVQFTALETDATSCDHQWLSHGDSFGTRSCRYCGVMWDNCKGYTIRDEHGSILSVPVGPTGATGPTGVMG